ncbi:MAG: ribosome recycling factor [Candidatus Spechtbacteria bacterium]|nr:ribosome recycling factor [Candidatus Spechtbacteria bacterium]
MDINILRKNFDEQIDSLESELHKLRTSRASAELVEDIKVEAYGTMMEIKQLGSISTPEVRTILIQPWDRGIIPAIEKALRQTELSISPVVEGDHIRINLPPLTEESRRELVKIVGTRIEESRVSIRRVREDAIKEIDKAEETGDISEDEKFKQRELVQKAVEEYNQKIHDIGAEKEKDLMEQ